jgi:hypothetical protein
LNTAASSASDGSGTGVTQKPWPASLIRSAVPGRMCLRSHMALGNTTWRLVVTVSVVVTSDR